MADLSVFADSNELANAAATLISEIGKQAIDRNGVFTFVLSGGSTPKMVYKRLSLANFGIEWSSVHLFWGDERCLPADDSRSNYRMAREAFISQVPIPGENIHPIRGELPSTEGAERYQGEIAKFFENYPERIRRDSGNVSFPIFDLILLGMGGDGHTASLFPGSPALEETKRWVVSAEHSQPPPPLVDRVTFTLPLINASENVVFLVSGEDKSEPLRMVFAGDDESPLPAQLVQPVSGTLTWLLDRKAAGMLTD